MIPLFTERVACSGCEHVFRPTLEDIPQDDGSVKRMFTCPRCCKEYAVARITERGLHLTHELQNVELGSEGAAERIEKLKEEIKKEVTRWVE